MPAATCSTIRRTTCCSVSTISSTSTSTRDRIKMFHVKDAEFNPTGRQGVYSGYQSWVDRAGRFRSLGDGQVDFGHLLEAHGHDFDGWAVVEWECCLKHPEDGAREGARFVSDHIIRVTDKAFDDFAGAARTTPPTAACSAFPEGRQREETVQRLTAASASAWSAAAATPSSAACTASPRVSTTATNWSPALFPRRRRNRRRRPPISASRPTAPMATSSRWRSARRG
jgi:hypothetical protein